MKIIRANKQIARLKGEISEIKKRISSSLNTHANNEFFKENFKDLTELLNAKILEMMHLKARVHFTNVKCDKFSSIINLGELKSYIDFLRELEPKEGIDTSHYEKEEFKSQLTTAKRNSLVSECQKTINELTDELDDFNAKTDLEEMRCEFNLFSEGDIKRTIVE